MSPQGNSSATTFPKDRHSVGRHSTITFGTVLTLKQERATEKYNLEKAAGPMTACSSAVMVSALLMALAFFFW